MAVNPGLVRHNGNSFAMTSIPDANFLVHIGRRIHRLGTQCDRVDRMQSNLPEDSAQYQAAHATYLCLLCEQTALEDLALAMQPRTLADAAVLLGIMFEVISEICIVDQDGLQESGERTQELIKLQKALAHVTVLVAEAAGVELTKTGDPSLPAKLAAVRSNTDL